MGGPATEARAAYERSLDIARDESALTFELRTEVSFCELLRQTDPAAAKQRLESADEPLRRRLRIVGHATRAGTDGAADELQAVTSAI